MALKKGNESLRERMWQLENQLKDRDDVIKMVVEKEKETKKEVQALKEKVEQQENQLKDKYDMIKMAVEKEEEMTAPEWTTGFAQTR